MKKRIAVLGAGLFAVTISTSLVAATIDTEKYLTVDTVETYEIVDGHEVFVEKQSVDSVPVGSTEAAAKGAAAVPARAAAISLWPKKKDGGDAPTPPSPPSTLDKISTIVTIGEKIWNFIKDNEPVVNQRYAAVSAVPMGVKAWEELEGWTTPRIRMYKNVYKNLYGMKVVEFDYRIAFAHNGTYKGVGKYISRLEVDPSLVDVAWGYKFNANGQILATTNAGTTENPVAAMEMRLNWSVGTVLRRTEQSVRLYVRGDGLFQDLSNGTIAPGAASLR